METSSKALNSRIKSIENEMKVFITFPINHLNSIHTQSPQRIGESVVHSSN